MSRVVIVGGGAAGVELSTLLGKAVTKDDEILLVEPETKHFWKPRLHEVAAGTFDNELDTVSYFTHGAMHGYRHVQAAMRKINQEARNIEIESSEGELSTLDYDYLVLAVGAVSNDFATPGAKENCLFLDNAKQARNAWLELSVFLRSGQDRNINIVGAGATGVELAAELARVSKQLERYRIAAKLNINLIEAAPRVLPNSPEKMSKRIHSRLEQAGVNILVDTRISDVNDKGMNTHTGQFLDGDMQFWAAGVKAPDWLKEIGQFEHNRINQIQVHDTLLTTTDDRIFALGDCASIPQGDGKFVPPKAQAANRAAIHLAQTLSAHLQGKALTPFVYNDGGMVVAVGHTYAVSAMRDGKLVLQGRMIRKLYDMIFLLHQRTLMGMYKVSKLVLTKRIKSAFKPDML